MEFCLNVRFIHAKHSIKHVSIKIHKTTSNFPRNVSRSPALVLCTVFITSPLTLRCNQKSIKASAPNGGDMDRLKHAGHLHCAALEMLTALRFATQTEVFVKTSPGHL
jgi:hypothetical protein